MPELDWYWWVLTGVGVVVIAYLKLKVYNALTRKKKTEEISEDDY